MYEQYILWFIISYVIGMFFNDLENSFQNYKRKVGNTEF